MARFRLNFMSGQITADGGSTLSDSSSPSSFAQIPTILSGSGDYMPLVINPSGVLGNLTAPYSPEVVYIIAHATNSNTVTVVRECEGTLTPSGGWAGASWIHSYTRDDFPLDTNLVTNGDFIAGGTAMGWDPTVTGGPDLGHWTANPGTSGWGLHVDQHNSAWTFSSTGSFGYQIPPFYGGGSLYGSPQAAYSTLTTTSDVGQTTLASNLFPVFPGEVIEVTGFVYLDNISGATAYAQVSIAQSTSTTTYSACATTTLNGTPAYHLPTLTVDSASTGGAWIPFTVTSVMNGSSVKAATVLLQGIINGTGVNVVSFAHIKVDRTTISKAKLPGTVEYYTGVNNTDLDSLYGPYLYAQANAQTLGASAVPATLTSGAPSYGNYYNHIGSYVVLDGAGRNLVGAGTSTLSSNTYDSGNQLNPTTSAQGTEAITLASNQVPLVNHRHGLTAAGGSVGTAITATYPTWSIATNATYTTGLSGTTDNGAAQLVDGGHHHPSPDSGPFLTYSPPSGSLTAPSAGDIIEGDSGNTGNATTGIYDSGHYHTFGASTATTTLSTGATLTSTGGVLPTLTSGTVSFSGDTDYATGSASEAVGTMAPFTTVYCLVKL